VRGGRDCWEWGGDAERRAQRRDESLNIQAKKSERKERIGGEERWRGGEMESGVVADRDRMKSSFFAFGFPLKRGRSPGAILRYYSNTTR
jgi:hypothetical protein